jgi:hypothetical protein
VNCFVSISAIDRLFRPKDYESILMFQFFHENCKVIISTKQGYIEPWTDQGWDICTNLRSGPALNCAS